MSGVRTGVCECARVGVRGFVLVCSGVCVMRGHMGVHGRERVCILFVG